MNHEQETLTQSTNPQESDTSPEIPLEAVPSDRQETLNTFETSETIAYPVGGFGQTLRRIPGDRPRKRSGWGS